tara:strand:+ start:199 stop:441 length:243 start_codon:yes stop_codon:yes gene_type:complete
MPKSTSNIFLQAYAIIPDEIKTGLAVALTMVQEFFGENVITTLTALIGFAYLLEKYRTQRLMRRSEEINLNKKEKENDGK